MFDGGMQGKCPSKPKGRVLMISMLMIRILMIRVLTISMLTIDARGVEDCTYGARPGRGCAGVPLYCTLYLKIFSQIFQSMQKFKGVVDHRHKGVTQRFKAQGTDQCVQRSIYTTPYNLFFIFYHFPY